MAVSFLFSAVAAVAYIPVAALLFVILDRYAEPRVSKSLFDEKKVMLTFAVGIALGLILSVIFVAYAFYLKQGDLGGASLVAVVFLLMAALLRRILVSTRTFGGVGGSDPLLPVHTLSYGAVSGGTIALGLGLDFFAAGAPASDLYLLALVSAAMILVEAWAGLRFGRAMRKGFSWVPPLSILFVEGLALVAVAPLFTGYAVEGYAALVLLAVGAAVAVYREEPRALRSLRKAVGVEREEARRTRFGRGSEEGALPSGGSEPEETGGPSSDPTMTPKDPDPPTVP